MVLIMRHGNAGDEKVLLKPREQFILQPFACSNVGECEKINLDAHISLIAYI